MRSTHAESSSHRAFGHAVRELRFYRGLSQEALGYAAGLHRNYVGAIERGELNPTIRTVLRLAVGLRIRPSRRNWPNGMKPRRAATRTRDPRTVRVNAE
jgi:transcriptional regulator with XRE-family HTH domain